MVDAKRAIRQVDVTAHICEQTRPVQGPVAGITRSTLGHRCGYAVKAGVDSKNAVEDVSEDWDAVDKSDRGRRAMNVLCSYQRTDKST